jgi:hypothetical protein
MIKKISFFVYIFYLNKFKEFNYIFCIYKKLIFYFDVEIILKKKSTTIFIIKQYIYNSHNKFN